jgi:hypothetical protein
VTSSSRLTKSAGIIMRTFSLLLNDSFTLLNAAFNYKQLRKYTYFKKVKQSGRKLNKFCLTSLLHHFPKFLEGRTPYLIF